MELVVEPSVVADTGSTLRAVAQRWPEVRSSASGSCECPSVDDLVADFLTMTRDGVWTVGSAVHDLGEGAVVAAASFVATDRHLRQEAR